jgi:hypothetical protein
MMPLFDFFADFAKNGFAGERPPDRITENRVNQLIPIIPAGQGQRTGFDVWRLSHDPQSTNAKSAAPFLRRRDELSRIA